ncbi:phosphonate ABC transporter ATP-binding protein [Paenibacillus sp. 598K]|uniref:phosphonate ABC transporter ATP-binding protein n=1 Tax=Paenibacillus sp. 598K TaxID=1117987 RepID=UPI000FF90477|nr:phosphonate ABC transporter ATP-binding protein [Paenibacillus sp. 598K]GBF77557.1 phosphonate ABC transporter ATP-binding protein [Paenibacillus sp. 598K]
MDIKPTLLDIAGLSKSYGKGKQALSDIGFSAKQGEFVSIIGPSGAGKSTLLRCINRMIDADVGTIRFDETEVNGLSKRKLRKLRTKIGMIFQHYNLVHRLSAIENVLHGRLGYKSTLAGALGLYSREEKARAYELLCSLGLEEHVHKRCDQLSGGQKQRVGIARALIQEPKLLLCDEPIASLDPSSAKVIMDQLRQVSARMGITVLVNLHQVDVAMRYSDRIIGVNQGRIVYNGDPQLLTDERIHHIYGSEAGELIIDIGGQHAG